MGTTTVAPPPEPDVQFRAAICWTGPIVGAQEDDIRNGIVRIAGGEDPALGKAFVAALVPVKAAADPRHYAPVNGTDPAHLPAKWTSDRHGWFGITAPLALWKAPAVGVLLVLLYNNSKSLAYYTFDDYEQAGLRAEGASRKGVLASRGAEKAWPPMSEEIYKRIKGAIDKAVKQLLGDQNVDALRKGLAEPHLAAAGADGTRREFVFAAASCQFPSAMLEDEIAGASYKRLASRLANGKLPRPQFLLLMGDQIYVDGTAGLFDPTSQFDRFVRPYEILFRMKSVREVLRKLPAFMMMDDHEIADNWEPRVDDPRPDPDMIEGRASYLRYERGAGPPKHAPVCDSRHPLWYRFRFDGLPVFMADTRTERTARTARRILAARIMSAGQMSALLRWLSEQPDDLPKIVASPSILLPRHARAVQRKRVASALRSDGWDGYPSSLNRVLAHIANEKIRNVVFLSGDEHLSCVARVEVAAAGGETVVVHSVHSSPLFAPFPFANSVRADLVATDEFGFHSARDADDKCDTAPGIGGQYACRVDTEFAAPGDGFAVLRFHRDDGPWMMECEFNRAGDTPPPGSRIVRTLA